MFEFLVCLLTIAFALTLTTYKVRIFYKEYCKKKQYESDINFLDSKIK